MFQVTRNVTMLVIINFYSCVNLGWCNLMKTIILMLKYVTTIGKPYHNKMYLDKVLVLYRIVYGVRFQTRYIVRIIAINKVGRNEITSS